MNPRLARHFAPCRADILGVRLRPFSIWHFRTLAALDCAAVDPQRQIDFPELAFAVQVCRRRPHTALEKITRPSRAWLWLASRLYFRQLEKQIGGFVDYVAHYNAGPRPRGGGRHEGGRIETPEPLYLAAALIQRGWPEAEAWACTPGLARWYLAAFRELSGRELKIWTPRHVALARKAGVWKLGEDY